MIKEEFRKKLTQLLLNKKITTMKKEDTSLIDLEIEKLRKEYGKSLYKEIEENGKYKRK